MSIHILMKKKKFHRCGYLCLKPISIWVYVLHIVKPMGESLTVPKWASVQ